MTDAHCSNAYQRQALGLVTHDNTGGPFVVECQGCGAVYPSFQCSGGSQIADTGDYNDTCCPHCEIVDPEECENVGLAWNTQQLKINALQQRLTAADERMDQAVTALNEITKVSRMGEKPFEIATLAIGEMSADIEQTVPGAVVPELTPELRWILGQMCFQHIHTAQALRTMGHQIARKAEDEQAVTIYWMLGHYLKDPLNWRQNAIDEMKAAAPAA